MKNILAAILLLLSVQSTYAQDKVQDDVRAAITASGRKKLPDDGTNGTGAKTYNPTMASPIQGNAPFLLTRNMFGPNVLGLFLQPQNNLSDIINPAAALQYLNGLSLAGGTMTGALGLGMFQPQITLDDLGYGGNRQILGQSGGKILWQEILGDQTARTGSNAGANYALCRAADTSGNLIDCPITIGRGSGVVNFVDGVSGVTAAQVGALPIAGGTMAGDILSASTYQTKTTAACTLTAGSFTGDGTATFVPTCLGAALGNDFNVGGIAYPPTRGTPGTPGNIIPNLAGSLLQYSYKGATASTSDHAALAVNWESVGGAATANGTASNAEGLFISTHCRPDANGNPCPNTWSQNWDHVISPATKIGENFGIEGDLSNFSGLNCSIGGQCITAYYFYGGINPSPNLAFHYFGNAITYTYSGTLNASGNTLTFVSGNNGMTGFNSKINIISIAGTTFRIDCTSSTTCTTDFPIATLSNAAFTATSSAVHEGLFFQDHGMTGSEVQDDDIFANDSARTIIRGYGNHKVGFDFTNDALLIGGEMKAGQMLCFNGAADCMSYSPAVGWLFSPDTNPSDAKVSINAAGSASFTSVQATSFNTPSGVGVSCSGTPTSSYTTSNGIVTHC